MFLLPNLRLSLVTIYKAIPNRIGNVSFCINTFKNQILPKSFQNLQKLFSHHFILFNRSAKQKVCQAVTHWSQACASVRHACISEQILQNQWKPMAACQKTTHHRI